MKPLIYVILTAMLGSGPVFAKHWHENDDHFKKHWDHDDDDRDRDHHAANCYFEPHDVRLIGQYYASRPHDLPPGLQKKYKRSGHLPPGWERRIQPLPVVVERQLVPVPAEYRRGFIDGSVVIYAPRTGIVIDVVAAFGSR